MLIIMGHPSAYLVGGTGAQALDQPAEHHSVLQRALQKRGRVRHALLRRLHDTQRDEPCNRLFCWIHGQTPRIPSLQAIVSAIRGIKININISI